MIRVFRVVATNGDTAYWATNERGMQESERLKFAELSWGRGLPSGIEAGMWCGTGDGAGSAGTEESHRHGDPGAFVRLEWHRVRTGIGWKLAKEGIIRHALRSYLARPWYTLPASA